MWEGDRTAAGRQPASSVSAPGGLTERQQLTKDPTAPVEELCPPRVSILIGCCFYGQSQCSAGILLNSYRTAYARTAAFSAATDFLPPTGRRSDTRFPTLAQIASAALAAGHSQGKAADKWSISLECLGAARSGSRLATNRPSLAAGCSGKRIRQNVECGSRPP